MDVQRLLAHWRKIFWLSTAAVALFVTDAALTTFGPPHVVSVIVREWRKAGMPSVATAASFSVSAGSFATQAKAATFAAALDASRLPVLVRVRPDDRRYQVLVGPYVSTDEAEHAQRTLAAWGLGDSRFVVDDTMRSPSTASVFGVGGESNGVVMVAAPGVLSVVFEMTAAPRTVEAKRTSATTIDVAIGQIAADAGPDVKVGPYEALALPDGVSLVHDLSVRSDPAKASLNAHLVVPGEIESRLRLEGKRVYLDLAWPKAPWNIRSAGPKGPALQEPADDAVARQVLSDPTQSASQQLAAAEARFHEIEPFLASVTDSDADVRAALRRSLDALRMSVEQLPPSVDRGRLLDEIDAARP